jgi:putative ABC transport system substrate-binding protein
LPSRRRVVAAAASLVLANAVQGQQPARVYRIGSLRATERTTDIQALPQALRDLGYVEGRNLLLDQRYGERHPDRLPLLARDLVAQRMEVIVAISPPCVNAAKSATTTVPIVFFINTDPVAAGYVDSLAHPGHNLTGLLITPNETLAAKKIEILIAVVSGAKRFAMLVPDDPSFWLTQVTEAQHAASSAGAILAVETVHNGNYAAAFAKVAAGKPDALLLSASTYFFFDRKTIIDLATKYRLPAIYEWPEQVEDGGLMSYGPPNLRAMYASIGGYVDRILKGAKPADMPVEQPTKLELVINAKAARAIGLAIPQSVLLRADRVIE